MTKNGTSPATEKHTITVTFEGADLSLYELIAADAGEDRRTPAQYVLLYLARNYQQPAAE